MFSPSLWQMTSEPVNCSIKLANYPNLVGMQAPCWWILTFDWFKGIQTPSWGGGIRQVTYQSFSGLFCLRFPKHSMQLHMWQFILQFPF